MDCDIEASHSPNPSRTSFSEESNEPLLGIESDEIPMWYTKIPSIFSRRRKLPLSVICNMTVILFSSIILTAGLSDLGDLDRRCAGKLTAWSPLHEIVDYEPSILDSEHASIYTGEWTDESYHAWHSLLKYPAIGITDDKLPLLNKSTAVEWKRHGDDSNFPGQIEAFIEGHHRMHCLFLVRMYAFRDRFDFSGDPYMKEHGDKMLRHVAHCIDNVRWGIQCHSDVTPYFFEKTAESGGGRSMPRLAVRRPAKCRNIHSLEKYLAEDLNLADHKRQSGT